jgi:hypothetical protein
MKKYVWLYGFLLLGSMQGYAQDDEFCNATQIILRDAPNEFRNIKQNIYERNATATLYRSGINLPGAIKSRFVSAMGLFYECALMQSQDLNAVKGPYEQYKSLLQTCTDPLGYQMVTVKNFNASMAAFPKLNFMPDVSKVNSVKELPGHITLELDYNKDRKTYTLLLLIFQH